MRALPHLPEELTFSAALPANKVRQLQRKVTAGGLLRVHAGIYAEKQSEDELAALVRRNWQRVVGVVVPGGVVSHISAMKGGVLPNGVVVLSHPASFNRKIALPGLTIKVVRGPGPLPGDMSIGTTGLQFAGRARMLLENIGRKGDVRARPEEVESMLVNILNASGEKALNDLRDQATALAPALGAEKALKKLSSTVGALLGTHSRGELKTKLGKAVAVGTPVDAIRMARFEVLAQHLRMTPLPRIDRTLSGVARRNAAFLESYFSNYVEGTKFAIEEARDIVMENKVMQKRPKDSHDILGVFRLAITTPYRDSSPLAGPEFLDGLEAWHAEMLKMRPEASPGQVKLEVNYAGTTQFVVPALVRGTLAEGSQLARSVPEGLARAIYYAFLVSEVHPFEDGNGRLSRLVMNAELTRAGTSRIIIPTLYHPQYVDCARALTRKDDPAPFVQSLAKMARWSSQFDFSDLDALIESVKMTNALEESPAEYRLLNVDGSKEA